MGGFLSTMKMMMTDELDKLCDCQRRLQLNDMRSTVFNLMMMCAVPNLAFDYITPFFIAVFNLCNSKCNETCSDARITAQSITPEEKQMIRRHLIAFSHLFNMYPNYNTLSHERHVLSGMVLFRTEILPVFREVIDDESNMIPFLLELVRHEGILRAKLSGNTSFKRVQARGLHFMRAGYLSDHLKAAHKWWQEGFVDSEDLDATNEYSLAD